MKVVIMPKTKKRKKTARATSTAATDGGPRELIITEKPSVARDIVAALGGKKLFKSRDGFFESNEHLITWAVGHLLEFLAPEDIDATYKRWRLNDLPIFPDEFTLKPKTGQKARLDLLKKLVRRKDVTALVNACDAGREGELIFREIDRYVGAEKPVKRLWLQSMTPQAIREGFAALRPGEQFEGLGCAAECRAESDWLIGMNATRALTKRLQTRRERTPWSVGRVQTPTLALMVDRELEILAHQSKPYWRIKGTFAAPEHTYEGWWFSPEQREKKDDEEQAEDRIMERAEAEAILAKVEGKAGTAREERKKTTEKAPPPFDLTSLQREANRRYSYSARRTLQTAQRLYEEHKLITYPRTDSRCLPSDYEPKVNEVLKFLATQPTYAAPAAMLLQKGLQNRTRVFNDSGVSDHFALMPTGLKAQNLPQAEGRIYDLIVRRFMAAFFPPAVWENVERITEVAGERFKTRTRVLRERGWHVVFDRKADGKEKLPPLPGDQTAVTTQKLEIVEEETKPRPRISEAGLLNLMENAGRHIDDDELSAVLRDKGLGTPATRSEIIENLIQRGYVKRVGKPLAATPKGIRLIDILRRIRVNRLASAELTGELEFHLRQIERGDRTRTDFTNEIKEYTQEIVERAKGFVFDKLYTKDPTLGRCPICKKRQVVEESLVYRCNGVAKDACSFLLWKEKHGRYLDRTTVETLLQNGRTPPVAGFFTREDKPYRAVLTLDASGQVQVEPEHALESDDDLQVPVDPTPIGACPVCKKGQIIETPRSYICSRGEKEGCPFALPRKLLARTMVRKEAAVYITEGKTPVLEGFISRRGRPFRASLILGENGRHSWEFPSREATTARRKVEIGKVVDTESLGPCPVCKKGRVLTTEGAYACRDGEDGCTFNLPRTILGREISREEAVTFVTDGQTDVLDGFISRRGRPFRAALVLGKNGKYRWKFPSRTQA